MSKLYAERDIENLETYHEHKGNLCEGRQLFSITKRQHKIIEQQQQEAHIKRVLHPIIRNII